MAGQQCHLLATSTAAFVQPEDTLRQLLLSGTVDGPAHLAR